jgi:hypothetical protein
MSSETTDVSVNPVALPHKKSRDWFGYIFTTVIGIAATIVVAWYQLYAAQNDAAAAELERARAVKQSAVSIVEEQALNGKKLEVERLTRLIDQRRRDERVSLPISATEVVEQAEFNITSSHHLSIEKKDEIKPAFDSFYADVNARSFQPFTTKTNNSDLLNQLAKRIQEGKTAEALPLLKRLDESYAKELAEAKRRPSIGLFDALNEIFSSPAKTTLVAIASAAYFFFANKFLNYYIRRRRLLRPLI